ncbi:MULTISPECIES: VWA domain-containing protein [Micromonospora]|uniref:VWA domain-containing protein n=1 Tax=Micromonospora solifontis TaxID=2487138 RepID=A0ABX9WK98_9ACTN|nr:MULTISPECIES: VWA domain-containing protein [Micromonospora]NES13689.1 VWA domain-containing protein [Micromonospora sp. PPF5-17B]NES35498.1 VWA domain-containing protein [Micromonospora solifontis]NES55345.1 VWA domain-containing protein [Micromonospora sp. PPF5-6]RNM00745.1 VWA domain-containing protein [Micromonospora solifontis]
MDRAADPGATIGISKVVSTPPIPPKPDVVLLVDTTGSMGPAIANVRTNLQQVINNVRGAQPSAEFAVASYRDEGDGAELFRVRRNLTGDATALQNAVNGLDADGGGDVPEGWVNALFQVSDGAIAYRSGSSRLVVLVGDAPSHDPSAGHTLVQATAALQADDARVLAVDVSGGGGGLDALGQATDVATATGGQVVGSAPDTVTAAILSGLRDLDVTVTPTVTSCDPGLSVSFDAASRTQQSGTDVPFAETITVAADATQGATLHCTVDFLLNGLSGGPAFVERISVTVNDVTPPTVAVDDQTVEATSPAGVVINYPASATDNVDGPLTPTCAPPPGSTFPLGTTTVTCTATDAAGNTGSDTAVMRVVDTTAPSTGCVPTNNPSGGNIPGSDNPDGFYQLTATDIVDTAVEVYIGDAADPSVTFGPFPAGTRIKLVQAPGAQSRIKDGTGDIDYKVTLRGDAVITGVDDAGNTSTATCLVAPPPK